MRPARRLVFAVLLACTPSERQSEVATRSAEASEPGVEPFVEVEPGADRRELGPRLGGLVTPRSPTLGRWAAKVEFDQHRYVTMEHTVGNRITGSVVMHLDAGGEARACVRVREASNSALGRLQARDGKDHFSSSDDESHVGMRGRWSILGEGPDIEVIFDRMRHDGCSVDPAGHVAAQPALRCFAFAANAAVPRDALLCEVPETLHALTKVALLIGDSPRVGGWTQRFDPAGHGEVLPDGAKPHLLLGADPGLALSTRDHDRDAQPLEVHAAEVEDPG